MTPQYISAVVLFLSLIVAIGALFVNRKTQQRLKAQDLWSTYLQKAIEHSALAYPPGHGENFNYDAKTVLNAEGKPDKREFERYEWFLSYLLKTAREILEHYSHDEFWKKTIRRNIRYHEAYLAKRKRVVLPDDDYIALSGREVNRLIDEILKENLGQVAVTHNQDRPAYLEELRFAKRQQWYVAASTVGLDAGVLTALRGLQLDCIEKSVITFFVVGIAFGSVWLLWKLQNHLRDTRLTLNSDDANPLTRGMEIVVALAVVVFLSAVAVIYLLWFPHIPPP
jgi:hypothetical protein